MLLDAHLVRCLGLRTRVAIKRELQRLNAEHDGLAAFLWTTAANGDKALSIESVGDPDALPRSPNLRGCDSYACDQLVLRSNDGEDRAVVLLYSRLCKDAPTLILGLVDTSAPLADVLVEDVEHTLFQIESIIVDALDPPLEAPRATRTAKARSAG